MLIIFDLDDTLIDTSAYITPPKLEKALVRMVEEGCVLIEPEKALKDLLNFNQEQSSSGAALELFAQKYNIDSKTQAIGLEELYDGFPEPSTVRPVFGALETLEQLSLEGRLAVVSVGNKEQQLFKLEKAGIPSSFFYKIFILEEKNKKKYYERLIEELQIEPDQVIVCGDRIKIDLLPAKEIGCYTVHMERGRGVNETFSSKQEVDFSITELAQLVEICAKIKDG